MRLPKLSKFALLTFVLFGFLFWHFAKEMLQVRSDGLYVGQVNLYGDLVLHLTLINKFIESGQILPESPIFASSKINYPIFADFITAQIARSTGIDFALFLTTLVGGLLTIYIARLFILTFIKNEKIVFLALLIFFAGGGFGFYYFFQDLFNSQKSFLEFLFAMPNEYTDIKEKGFWWINTYLAYFLPQRGFLFAFPITLTILMLLYRGHEKLKMSYFAIAGLLAGVLPLVQAHSLFFIFLISTMFMPLSVYFSGMDHRKNLIKSWVLFATICAALSLPILSSISENVNFLNFIRMDPGWTSQENILWFWTKNLGLFAPILALTTVWIYRSKKKLFVLYMPFLLIFLVSNIFVFQPWDFDNSKLLVYWYFASSVLVAYFLYHFLFSENIDRKILGSCVIALIIFSGVLDIFRTFTPITSYQIFSSKDILISESVKNLTVEDGIFVTAPIHNHPIPALGGRSTLVGYHGWLWSHGINYTPRAYDVANIYAGNDFENLISKYKISYLTVGPHEVSEFDINYDKLSQFPRIALDPDWIIYDVTNIWTDSNRQN